MNLLSIAGSDPSSGAGIQSDVKTFTELGAYALTVITTITSQNTSKFGNVEPISAKMIKKQIDIFIKILSQLSLLTLILLAFNIVILI